MSERPLVVVADALHADAQAWLASRCRVTACAPDAARDARVLEGAAGLVVRTDTHVDAALLALAPRLAVVGRAGAGLDNIDVAACRDRGVEVVYTPDANTQAVVEYVFRLLTEVLRPVVTLEAAVDAAQWRSLRARTVGARQLSELTLGILGLGRIGSRVAAVAKAFGFRRVPYNDLLEIPSGLRAGAEPVSVEALFAESDVLTVHVDGRPANRGLVGPALIDRMRPGVIFLNTSRGFVVDSFALSGFLRSHPASQALLDVHEQEPFGPNHPLLGLPNARLYPHLASRTAAAMAAMSWVVRDVVAVLAGRPPLHPAPA